MAEYLCRKRFNESSEDIKTYTVGSRSLSTNYEPINSPPSAQGVQVLREDYGLDMTAHRSQLLSAQDIADADLIVPVKRDLGARIVAEFPEAKGKMFYLSQDISDPWHDPVSVFRSCAQLIYSLLDEVIEECSRR